MKHSPPKFERKFDPEGAQRWIMDIEKIFNVMGYRKEHKVVLCHLYVGRRSRGLVEVCQSNSVIGKRIYLLGSFQGMFLGNYFPRNLNKQKVQEFLELKQGNMSVGEYVAKFPELMKYLPHFQHKDEDEDICARFENGQRPEIRAAVSVNSGFHRSSFWDMLSQRTLQWGRGKFFKIVKESKFQ
ncbi:uncharacterized protein LOC113870078 [Abrus precatorius]|uniref:Uncharacterized protein LOC113870078 n=1 Tax=Abrus precatorius TaxID=3816 RepID=A0A8B8M3E5_ABRPR|nr:uncharacterized protein LOC113870078 [Abrus precatorius]